VPGGVTLGESTSQVLPAITRLGPHDRSDIDSDAIKRLEAEKKQHLIQVLIQLQKTLPIPISEVTAMLLITH
jgi:hypothetical protein